MSRPTLIPIVAGLLGLALSSAPAEAQSSAAFVPKPSRQITGPLQLPSNIPANLTLPDGSVILPLPSVSGDPRFEIWLPPGLSGSPTQIERFQIQVPLAAILPPYAPRPALIGYHFFGVSEQAVFNQDIPLLCANRGWFLIAPFGVSQVNFANQQSQDSLDAILDWIEQFIQFDSERLYGLGFSMGGLNSLSVALRRQDEGARRFAAVGSLLGTVDPVFAYEQGTPTLQTLLQHPDVFGGTPNGAPFAYERVATARMTPGLAIDDERAGVNNLFDTGVYLGINLADPTTNLLTQNQALAGYLQSKGFNVFVDSFFGPPVHAWGSFDHTNVFAFFDGQSKPGPVDQSALPLDLYADRPTPVRFTEVRDLDPNTVVRYSVSRPAGGGNALSLEELRGVRELFVDGVQLGLQTGSPVTLTTFGEDSTAPGARIVLPGYASTPSSVTVGGLAPAFLAHDPQTGELTIQPRVDSAFAVTSIVP